MSPPPARHNPGKPPVKSARLSSISNFAFSVFNRTPVVWVLLLTAACLLPFVNRAFFIDDTLFLRVAEQIQEHPADFYGFRMNWFRTEQPMIDFFYNPPLASYYLALVAGVAGWRERALHLGFLIPALAAAWGIFSLARLHCCRPLLAAIAAVLTPVVLVSATTVMCDVMMLAFWVWSLVWFEKGLRQGECRAGARHCGMYLVSGFLAGLAYLTKFPALMLVPLWLAYGWVRQKRFGCWLAAALVPLMVAIGYELVIHRLYGQWHLLHAALFSHEERMENGLGSKLVVGLGFMGGCFLPLLLYAPLAWSRRALGIGLCVAAPLVAVLPWIPALAPYLRPKGNFDWLLWAQSGLFTVGGVHLLGLAALDWWDRRDSGAVLLVLWVFGVFVFGTAVNWMINGRSFLVMAPALGILLARRIEKFQVSGCKFQVADEQSPNLQRATGNLKPGTPFGSLLLLGALCGSLALSLLVARADYNAAGAERTAALEICARHNQPGQTIWFEGHWGFQYYLETQGAKALDFSRPGLTAADLLVIPNRGSGVAPPNPRDFSLVDTIKVLPNPHLSTFNPTLGACFYAARRGPLPYAVGKLKPDYYLVFSPKPR